MATKGWGGRFGTPSSAGRALNPCRVGAIPSVLGVRNPRETWSLDEIHIGGNDERKRNLFSRGDGRFVGGGVRGRS